MIKFIIGLHTLHIAEFVLIQ